MMSYFDRALTSWGRILKRQQLNIPIKLRLVSRNTTPSPDISRKYNCLVMPYNPLNNRFQKTIGNHPVHSEYTRGALGCTLPPVWLVSNTVYLIYFLIRKLSYIPPAVANLAVQSFCSQRTQPYSPSARCNVHTQRIPTSEVNQIHPSGPLHIINSSMATAYCTLCRQRYKTYFDVFSSMFL